MGPVHEADNIVKYNLISAKYMNNERLLDWMFKQTNNRDTGKLCFISHIFQQHFVMKAKYVSITDKVLWMFIVQSIACLQK